MMVVEEKGGWDSYIQHSLPNVKSTLSTAHWHTVAQFCVAKPKETFKTAEKYYYQPWGYWPAE
jgi:hypothetical protein